MMLGANSKVQDLIALENIFVQNSTLPPQTSIQPIQFNYYNFICTFINFLQDYVRTNPNQNFNFFLLNNYINKYKTVPEQHRHFFGFTKAWKKFIAKKKDAKLFLCFLEEGSNGKEFIRWFLRLRKIILKNITSKILQQTLVTHSDTLTICHIIFQEKDRPKMSKKINELFINLKRKMINTAKYIAPLVRIDGASACEFFISIKEESESLMMKKREQSTKYETKKQLKEQHNVSFSEEFAQYYNQTKPQSKQNTKKIFLEFEDLEEEWEKEQMEQQNFTMARNQLMMLFERDKNMDQRLQKSGIVKKKYPEGWEEFLKTNKKMKEKLLNEN